MQINVESLKSRLLKNSMWVEGCLISTYKAHSQSGYAIMKFGKTTRGAHRVSWMVHFGDIPKDLWVLHKCDNPLCINPDHLFLGTAKDNTDDMIKKNRDNYSGAEKYPVEIKNKIIELKRLGKTYKEISLELNIPSASIASIIRSKKSEGKVSEFYNKPTYTKEIVLKAFELRDMGVKCKDIQRLLNIPKRSLSRILNTPYKRFDFNHDFL